VHFWSLIPVERQLGVWRQKDAFVGSPETLTCVFIQFFFIGVDKREKDKSFEHWLCPFESLLVRCF